MEFVLYALVLVVGFMVGWFAKQQRKAKVEAPKKRAYTRKAPAKPKVKVEVAKQQSVSSTAVVSGAGSSLGEGGLSSALIGKANGSVSDYPS